MGAILSAAPHPQENGLSMLAVSKSKRMETATSELVSGTFLVECIGGNMRAMKTAKPSRKPESVRPIAQGTPGLELLLLSGSRGREDASPVSDWDFGYLGTRALDVDRLRAELTLKLGTERVDLVDLDRAGGFLRYRAARDGVVIYESREGVFQSFWLEAVRFWCEAGSVLEAGYASILAGLGR